MMTRELFMNRVRKAVHAGNEAGKKFPLPSRGKLGYQGIGDASNSPTTSQAAIQKFCTELANAGGTGYFAENLESARQTILSILQRHAAKNVVLGNGGWVSRLGLGDWLSNHGIESATVGEFGDRNGKDLFFAANVGISNVHRLIAETGTVVMATAPHEPRSLSLLPPVHIALADRSQILADLFDLFDLFCPSSQVPPSCLSLITGPSKTGDIELRLVTGVHGPGEVHVIVIDS